MATATDEVTLVPPTNRDEAAEIVLELLTDDPQSEAALARQMGYPDTKEKGSNKTKLGVETGMVHSACEVLAARQQAKRIPNTAGSKQGGWVLYTSPLQAPKVEGEVFEWPFDGVMWVPLAEMFVDADYQRPLTSFASTIQQKFDPFLFQTLVLSDRGARAKPNRYAIIDGQTRWIAAQRLGVKRCPAIIFTDLSPEDEADIFWKLQKFRKGVISWYRFRAQMRSGNEESLAIADLASEAGYDLGDRPGQIKAVTALEYCYRRDPDNLVRTLETFKDAWQEVPEGKYIRGLFYFFLNFPVDQKFDFQEVDDERLVRRLKINGPNDVDKKVTAAKEIMKGSPMKLMALAIQGIYQSRERKA